MNILAIKIIVAELNHMQAIDNPENIFEISFDISGDLVIDWRNRKARTLLKNLAKELSLDYHEDFKLGHTRAHDLSEKMNTSEKIVQNFKQTLEEYIEIAEIFIK